MAKDQILMASGFLPEIVSQARTHWDVKYIHAHKEAWEYLRSCDSLPLAIVIGYVTRTPPGQRPTWPEDDEQLPAHVMLRRIHDLDSDMPVIVSASEHHSGAIVELIKRGAFDYVAEPKDKFTFNEQVKLYGQELMHSITKALRWRKTIIENRDLRVSLEDHVGHDRFITRCPRMQQMVKMISKAAPTPAPILITGESGTGKELIARMIHEKSDRRNKPFVAINCGAVNESLLPSELFGHTKGAFTGADIARPGLVRQAGGGTMLLDELGTTSLSFQVMLLRVLEERTARSVGEDTEYPVKCRFIAAANTDLHEMSRNGEFREDLFYRLNMFHLELIPLRERPEDIPIIANHFVLQYASEYHKDIKGLLPESVRKLESHHWPGNVRELRNAIERAVILCEDEYVTPGDLNINPNNAGQDDIDVVDNYKLAIENYEKLLLRKSLARYDGNIAVTASALGMNRTTLLYRIRKLKLKIP